MPTGAEQFWGHHFSAVALRSQDWSGTAVETVGQLQHILPSGCALVLLAASSEEQRRELDAQRAGAVGEGGK